MSPAQRIVESYALCAAHLDRYVKGCVDCDFRKTVVVEILLDAVGDATKSLG